MVIDLDTGKECEAPQSVWDRVAACMALTSEQVRPKQQILDTPFQYLVHWWNKAI